MVRLGGSWQRWLRSGKGGSWQMWQIEVVVDRGLFHDGGLGW